MSKKVKNLQVIIFSDDIDWCKRNLKFKYKTIFEEKGLNSAQKLELMSYCKYFIISNSTFSWWAQYLSTYKNKITIAPNRWKNSRYINSIYQKDWILIDPSKDVEE